jgi:hypothetical protein
MPVLQGGKNSIHESNLRAADTENSENRLLPGTDILWGMHSLRICDHASSVCKASTQGHSIAI